MSRQVGRVSIEYFEPLDSIPSYFVDDLMFIKAVNCYMSGQGRVWTDFSFDEIMGYADEYAAREGLTQAQRESITAWLESLPWNEQDDERYIELYMES